MCEINYAVLGFPCLGFIQKIKLLMTLSLLYSQLLTKTVPWKGVWGSLVHCVSEKKSIHIRNV